MGDRLERRAELHQAISLQVKNLARLVDDLMDVSRVTRGKISLRIEELDVNEVVRRAIQTVSMPERITAALTAQPTRTMADSLRLEQIVGNLLGNASKYSPPDSPIRVSTRLTGSRVQVVVEDEGCGIEADELQSIFETFVQVEQPLDRARGGLGIGLTIARSLAELHGGRLWAESEGVGRGARFLLELPLQRLRERGPTEGMTTQAEGLRIVLLEDNLVASEAIVALLEELGHAAVAVHDGVEGLKALLQERPDVALVDIGLPGMDGFEVARRLRAETQDVHLVAVTGYGQPKDRARAEASGFDDFLVKPVDLPTLEGVLARRKRAS
ncbi:MAG: ATP-binding protein [Myxococcota bacterium]